MAPMTEEANPTHACDEAVPATSANGREKDEQTRLANRKIEIPGAAILMLIK